MLPENIENVLVIGASGGIAQACLSLLQNTPSVRSIVAVSRSHLSRPEPVTSVETMTPNPSTTIPGSESP